jgi:hypothetical protein
MGKSLHEPKIIKGVESTVQKNVTTGILLAWDKLINSVTKTNSVQLSPSQEANNCAATQEHPTFYGT